MPQSARRLPAAVLIAGSGPHGRDELVAGHRPFLVLADFLTRNGIAVLRYDKRGVEGSGGNYAEATTADFASDAEAAFEYLCARPEIDAHKVGLIGHIEGAVIAPMGAPHRSEVAFVVMLAGSGVPGDQVLIDQVRQISESSGMTPEQNAGREREILVKSERSPNADTKLRVKLARKIPEAQLGAQLQQIKSPWMRYFINYDPAVALPQV